MTLFAKPGAPVTINSVADWIDDKFYGTVEVGSVGGLRAFERRPLPAFGEFPGEREQAQYRWPDILRWYVNNADFERAPSVLGELRAGARRMTRMLAETLSLGLKVRPRDKAAVIDMIYATHFGDVDSEWALANLIDVAVELAADETEPPCPRVRDWAISDGAPL